MGRNPVAPTIWAIAGIFIITMVVLTGLAQRFGWQQTFGNSSLLSVAIAVITTFGATGSLFFLARRAMHDDAMAAQAAEATRSTVVRDRLARIEKAAELLASGKRTAEAAGIATAAGLAEAEPDKAGLVCLTLLNSYVAEQSSAEWQKHHDRMEANQPAAEFARSHAEQTLAVCQIALLRSRWGSWVGSEEPDGRYFVDRWYIGFASLRGGSFDQIWIQNSIFCNVTFRDWSFRNAYAHLVVHGTLRFQNCDLTNFKIAVRDSEGRSLNDPNSKATVIWENCVDRGFEVVANPVNPDAATN